MQKYKRVTNQSFTLKINLKIILNNDKNLLNFFLDHLKWFDHIKKSKLNYILRIGLSKLQ
jgi:hypothetical protein